MRERDGRQIPSLVIVVAGFAVAATLGAGIAVSPGPAAAATAVAAVTAVTAPDAAPGHRVCPVASSRCTPSSPLTHGSFGLGTELACIVAMVVAALPLARRYRRRRPRSTLPDRNPAVLLRPPRIPAIASV